MHYIILCTNSITYEYYSVFRSTSTHSLSPSVVNSIQPFKSVLSNGYPSYRLQRLRVGQSVPVPSAHAEQDHLRAQRLISSGGLSGA